MTTRAPPEGAGVLLKTAFRLGASSRFRWNPADREEYLARL